MISMVVNIALDEFCPAKVITYVRMAKVIPTELDRPHY